MSRASISPENLSDISIIDYFFKNGYEYLTGSQYVGNFIPKKRTMEGFGIYMYPDGSEYRGIFHKGLFEGYGVLKIVYPIRCTYKGNFKKGEIIDIEELVFEDGVSIKGPLELIDNQLNLDNWNYLRNNDRRFVREAGTSLTAVEPKKSITPAKVPTPLAKNTYDCEEGIFKKTTGFLGNVRRPFPNPRFINCATEQKWIKDNCRRQSTKAEIPKSNWRKKIVETNKESLAKEKSNLPRCSCKLWKDKFIDDDASKFIDKSATKSATTPKLSLCSSTKDSFTQTDIIPKIKKNVCKLNVKTELKTGRVIGKELNVDEYFPSWLRFSHI